MIYHEKTFIINKRQLLQETYWRAEHYQTALHDNRSACCIRERRDRNRRRRSVLHPRDKELRQKRHGTRERNSGAVHFFHRHDSTAQLDKNRKGYVRPLRKSVDDPKKSLLRLDFDDVQMPVMDGLEATRQLRASSAPNAAFVPIIAMTANVFKEDVDKCISAGMNGHLGKPLNLQEVIGVLKEYLLQL
ncbi:MAG: response regulator [Synergistaceae bacterium]|nr:response regulator [Synergistaceae bacterium]